jgi:type II secretory pathway pseudopilin PulG
MAQLKRSHANATQRGLTMIIALVVVAVLLFVAVVLLSNAFGSVATETSIRAKIAAFDAAEAGINEVVDVLDRNHGDSSDCAKTGIGHADGSLADGGTYTWCIAYNGILKGAGTIEDHDNQIQVPNNTVFAWSQGNAQDGGRGVLIEALIAPSTGLPLPTAAIAAAGDVYSRADVSVYESGPGSSDAVIRANGNLYAVVAPRIVQGSTFASGIDQINGANGTNPNAPAMTFPTQDQINAAAQNASGVASSTSPSMSPPDSSMVIDGSAYIEGDVDLQNGTVQFQRGQSVYINGNLCIEAGGHIVNDGATIWVTGTMSTIGARGAYTIAPGSNGSLIVLGSDDGRMCANGKGQNAVVLGSNGQQPIGFVYAPNGSIAITGRGTLIGAIDAGRNVYLDSSKGGGLHFDPRAVAPIPTYDFKIVSYMEY